eukprot:TRINITY_DN66625_c0_g1_i1.p1 TRINITY_DN66625_c0_g1~~TRINITY_DN66625_c0_g1_i1.p1  ORF type:complete len:279 (+),score=23.14 TRINITY_DN66625_c0_g1_i1:42-839(+)
MSCCKQCLESADFELDTRTWKETFTPSCGMNPVDYFTLRLVMFLVWAAVTCWSFYDFTVEDEHPARLWFIYLTHWGALWEAFYFFFAAYSVWQSIWGTVPDGKGEQTPWFVSVTWFLSSALMVITLMVFTMYWVLVYKPENGPPAVLSVATHGLNFVLALLDFSIVKRLPYNFAQLWVPLLFAFTYATWTYVFYILGGRNEKGEPFIYEAINWANPEGTRNLLGLLVVVVGPTMYAIFWCLWRHCCGKKPQNRDGPAFQQLDTKA